MSRLRLALLIVASAVAAGCYKDDPTSGLGCCEAPSILIQGATSMPVGRTHRLEVFVIDSQHQQDSAAPVAWQNLDTTVLALVVDVDTVRVARVTSKIVGTGRIVATSGQLADTLVIQVVPDASSRPSPRP